MTDFDNIDQLLMTLEDQGIEVIDEADAQSREQRETVSVSDVNEMASGGSLDVQLREDDEYGEGMEEPVAVAPTGSSRGSDDPVRMYLTQMGEIPLLRRERKKLHSPRRSKSPAVPSVAKCSNAITRSVSPSTPCNRFIAVSYRSIVRLRSPSLRTWKKIKSSAGCRTTSPRWNACWMRTRPTSAS